MQCKLGKQYATNQSPLYCLRSKRKLARILRISYSKLIRLTSVNEMYLEKKIFNRKKGKELHIQKPKPSFIKIHERIRDLLAYIKLPRFIYSSRKGCSYIDNAKLHIGNSVLRKLDIKSYFMFTSSKRVFWFFHERMRCSKDVAGILTKLLTFKGCLPTGSSASPLMSYYAHIDMWESIGLIAMESNCTLSVWIDDITVSGTTDLAEVMWKIKKAIRRSGLNYHKEKYYAGKKSREVTGVIIANERLQAPKKQHLKRKDLLLEINRDDNLKNQALKLKLGGLEAQIHQIEKYHRTD